MDEKELKQAFKALQKLKQDLENQKREQEFQMKKLNEQKAELETQIYENFNTLEETILKNKLHLLYKEAETILQDLNNVRRGA